MNTKVTRFLMKSLGVSFFFSLLKKKTNNKNTVFFTACTRPCCVSFFVMENFMIENSYVHGYRIIMQKLDELIFR